jgi:hypothetical protein
MHLEREQILLDHFPRSTMNRFARKLNAATAEIRACAKETS